VSLVPDSHDEVQNTRPLERHPGRVGQSERVTLPLPAIDEDEWRAEFEAFAHGHYDAPEFLQQTAYRLAINVNLETLRPKRYLVPSDTITNSFPRSQSA